MAPRPPEYVAAARRQTRRPIADQYPYFYPAGIRRSAGMGRVAQERCHMRLPPRRYTHSTSPAETFTYHIAASFSGKEDSYFPDNHTYHFDQDNYQPVLYKAGSRVASGQDSFFVSPVDRTGSVAFGIADGVGGWIDSGVDPADFAHGLCGYMATAASQNDTKTPRRIRPREIMQKGYDSLCADRSILAGGSTACVAVADPNGALEVANLGDSGFLHIRSNAVHAYSVPQTHAFNTPYQLSRVPDMVAARMSAYGGAQLSDLPKDADITQHAVRHGDILIFATDGVFDNVFNQDILRTASKTMLATGAWENSETGGVRPSPDLRETTVAERSTPSHPRITLQSMLATELVALAKSYSLNRRLDGPFAKEVQKYYPHENWQGGKVDDICVVVAVVSSNRTPRPRL